MWPCIFMPTLFLLLQVKSLICERPLKKSPPPKRQQPSCSSPTSGKWRMSFMNLPWNSFSLCAPTPSGKRTESFTSWVRTTSTKRFIPKLTEDPGCLHRYSVERSFTLVGELKKVSERHSGIQLSGSPSDGTVDSFFLKRLCLFLIAPTAVKNWFHDWTISLKSDRIDVTSLCSHPKQLYKFYNENGNCQAVFVLHTFLQECRN